MTQQETPNPLFGGFQPQVIEGNALPVEPAAPKAETAKQKAAREKREAKAAEKAAGEAKKAASTKRKPRAAKPEKRAPKFDLQTILTATAGLKETDMAGFEKGLNALMNTNAAGRARLLAAWAKVFA